MNFLEPIQNTIKTLDLVLKTSHSIPEIPNLLNRTVLLGGKRLRPALCFLMGEALNVPSSQLIPFARSAEFTHSASLAHDDVVDSALTRRNQNTINAESSNKKAVLAGDLLLARVMVELSQQGYIEIIHDLSLVVEDLVNGEWLQMALKGKTTTTHVDLIEVSKRKTASLMSWCCTVPARLSDYSNEELIHQAHEFGENLGIAFQMMDDVIDFNSFGEKDYAKDVKEGLVNYVISDLIKNNPSIEPQIAKILGVNQNHDWPWTQASLENSVNNVRKLAQSFSEKAMQNLIQIKKIVQSSSELTESQKKSFESLEGLVGFITMRQN